MELKELTKTNRLAMDDFLYEAIFVPPGKKPFPREIISRPDMRIYVDGFDPENNRGDCGVIAEEDGKIIGMAWVRIIESDGYIDDETPVLTISLLPGYRGRGIGESLMLWLFDLLKARGFRRTSLSVQAANPAARFYKRLGYEIHEVFDWNVEVWTMVKVLVYNEA